MHSIRVKITAVTIAAILTSILALGGIGVFTIGVESDRSSVEKMALISENMQKRLDAYLVSIKQSVDMAIHMADDSLDALDISLFAARTPEQAERFDEILANHCAEVEHAFASIANSTSGIVTYYYCINSDLGSSEHGFFWSKLDADEFTKQPPLISSELDINDIEHTTWYYSPLKAGRPVWIGPYLAHFLGDRWTVSYVAPIYCHGFLIGVLGMDILFDTIIEQVRSLQIYKTGFAFLMDKDGHILYHPEMEIGSVPDTGGRNLDEELLKRRSSGSELIRYSINGEELQLAFSTLSNNTKVAVTAPVSEINAAQRRLSLVILGVTAVIVAVFAVITLLTVNAITKPLLHLTAASRRLAAGDYDVALDYNEKDEVGTLTAAFRQMRDHLKLYIGDLNSRANTDAMTGVKNKGAFNLSIGRLNDSIRPTGAGDPEMFAIILFDCNGLKQINDNYGHERGDLYLKTACRMICQVFAHCPVYRLGGDEFGVILQGAAYHKRDELMESFDRLAASHNAEVSDPWEKVDIAKGLSVYAPDADLYAEQVLKRADEKMYEDKKQQRQACI